MEDVWTEWMKGCEASLKDVETWLGDDHNLVLLRARLVADPQSFGDRIHREKPPRLVRRIGRLWEAGQAESKSVEKFEKEVRKKGLAA